MVVNFKLLNVILCVDEHAKNNRELYMRYPRGASSFNDAAGVLVTNQSVDFLTYINACSISKWRKYAGINEVWLRVVVCGKGKIETKAVFPGSSEAKVLDTISFEHPAATEVEIPISANGADLVAFAVTPLAGETVELYEACYFVKVDEIQINDVRLALSTTTFKKEEYIVPNIALVKRAIAEEGDPIASRFHMFVVDNGRTLDAESLSDDIVTVIPNPNVGGAGGFARGMIAAEDDDVDYTHVLLMDDDVRILPESLIRTFNLLSLARGKYKGAFVNGAMLSLENPTRQFEDVAYVHKSGGYSRIKDDLDVSIISDIVENERIDTEVEQAYGAWWYSCIPMKYIEKNGLPMPFFVRCDDVEFGVRNKGTYMTMNGICVWHASFEGRFRASVDCYQYVRNSLVMIAVDDCSSESLFMSKLRTWIRRALRDMDYASAEMYLDGLEDYLKGPDFLTSVDGAALMKTNGARNEKTVSVSAFDARTLEESGVDEEVLSHGNLTCHDSIATRLLKLLPYDKHYLPDLFLDTRPAYVVKNGITTLEGRTLRKKTLVCLDPTRTRVSLRKMDKSRFRAVRKREARLLKRYRKTNARVRESYRKAFPYLTSKDFWSDYLGITS